MDNKLSELSKPVAWEVKGILCHSEEEARAYVGEPEPLYSQEYVSALTQRIAELEAKLATPVRLVDYRNSPDMHTKQYYEAIGFNQGIDACSVAVRTAGFTVEGDE